MNGIPDNFDWVTARSECSIRKVFETLKLQVGNDIEIRNDSLLPNQKERYSYGVASVAGGFTVFLEGLEGVRQSVLFSITNKGSILVRDEEDKILLEGKPTVCDDGKCRLSVDGRERELWQVRRTALENLFFHTY